MTGGQGAVEISGPHTGLNQRPHLVLHEGDQGGDNQGDAGQHKGGHLIAQGFARPGRHDAQGIPARHDMIDELPLSGAKGGVAECPL